MTLHVVRPPRPRVIIAGGGVAALETVLALRAAAGDLVSIQLVAPEAAFTYRAMSVAEPFGYARPVDVPLARITRDHDVLHERDRVQRVDASQQAVTLAGGRRLEYDALLLATGAAPRPWLQHAITFGGPAAVETVRGLLERLRDGEAQSVVFAAPPNPWTLPLYELALMTATWCAEHGVTGVELAVATPEEMPLEIAGPAAGDALRNLLADRGIALRRGVQAERFNDRGLRLSDGHVLAADAVVTLPVLDGRAPEGVPTDNDGFIPTGAHGEVPGLAGVYAAGDGTSFAIKQGGIAAQQADTAAAAILHGFGIGAEPAPFEPVVRGLLMTGLAAAYLRGGEISYEALWWPPTKIAGRHLGPFLAELHEVGGIPELAERPLPADAVRAAADRRELRRLALEMAESDARWGDHRSALRWLQTVEWLDGALPQELALKRAEWRARVGHPALR